MKKILAIILVLCLGILIMPNVKSDIQIDYRHQVGMEVLIDNASNTGTFPIGWGSSSYIRNTTNNQSRYLFYPMAYYDPSSALKNLSIRLYIDSVTNAGNITVHSISNQNGSLLIMNDCNWTYTYRGILYGGSAITWVNPGGDYNSTELDKKYIDTGSTFVTFDITNYLLLSNNAQFGLIFIADSGTNISILGGRYTQIRFNAFSGETTSLIKDTWNLKGYAGATDKNASTIYSSITNCTAISYKNETSGYWYTYWPDYGLLENQNLTFGDGLFILTDLNSTWDHT